MNAIEFVKKFGIIVAKDLAYRDNTSIGYLSVEHHNLNQEELKKIVSAFEWVEKFGGLDGFKDEYMSRIENNECVSGMDKTIELVENFNES